jgi:hypothetical protein
MSTAIATGFSGIARTAAKSVHKREVTRSGAAAPSASAHKITSHPPLHPSTPATQHVGACRATIEPRL